MLRRPPHPERLGSSLVVEHRPQVQGREQADGPLATTTSTATFAATLEGVATPAVASRTSPKQNPQKKKKKKSKHRHGKQNPFTENVFISDFFATGRERAREHAARREEQAERGAPRADGSRAEGGPRGAHAAGTLISQICATIGDSGGACVQFVSGVRQQVLAELRHDDRCGLRRCFRRVRFRLQQGRDEVGEQAAQLQ